MKIFIRYPKSSLRGTLIAILVYGSMLCFSAVANAQAEKVIAKKIKSEKEKAPKLIAFQKLEKSEAYHDALKNKYSKKRTNLKEFYTEKWFEPGTFYGQLFLSEDGYLNIFEWLNVPQEFSLIETKVSKENEYLIAYRSYLNSKSHFLELSIIAPHPRSFEAIKLGLVPKYQDLFPSQLDIEQREEVQIDEQRRAEIVTMKSGACKLIYSSAAGTRIVIAVEHFRFKQSALNLIKSMNLSFFEQRIQS